MTSSDSDLTSFVRDEHPRLVGAVALYSGDLDLAEECAAEALARVAHDWPRIGRMDAPGAYAHRIAMNLANSWFRRRRARIRALARSGPTDDEHRDPDAATVIAVRDAVASLPRRQRACVVLHHFVGLTGAEVAEVLGVHPGTVRSNLHTARGRLRELLGDDIDAARGAHHDGPTTTEVRRGR